MAIEKTIELNVDSKGAQADFGKLADAIQELNKTFSKFSEDTTDGLEDIKKSSKETEKGVSGISKGFKGLGVAIKAAGIGLVIAAIGKLGEVFSQNQKFADLFNTTFEAVSIVFNDFVNFVAKNTGGVVDSFKSIFENPAEAIKDLGRSIYEGVVVRFEQLVEVLGLTGKAIGQLVKGEFSAAFDTIKEAGKQTVDVFTGVDDSFESVAETVSNYAKETLKAATENVKLANNSKLAAAQQGLLVEKYDRQAEQLRQIRDDERNSLSDRKKANEDLLLVLAEQESSMLSLAEAQLKSAQAEASKNNSIENQVAVTEALANKLGVLAQIEGFRSEQQANDLALSREQIELTNSKNEAESNLSIERQRFNAEQIDDELLKLEALREIDLLYGEKEAERLQAIVDNANADTQAKVDAQIVLDEFMEQSRQTNLTRDTEILEAEAELDKQKIADKKAVVDAISQFADAESGIGKALLLIKQGLALQETIMDLKRITFKGVEAIGSAGVSTAQNVAESSKIGFPQNIITIGSAIAQGVGIISSVKKAVSKTKAKAGASASASVPSISTPSIPTSLPPSFNVVGATETSVLSDAVAGQTNQPVQAYVVANDVTTAQSLENNIIEGATI